jgi:hypothetical protein
MKLTLKSVRTLAAALITLGSLASEAYAEVNISNLIIADDTISISVSGTLAGPVPSSDTRILYLVPDSLDNGWITSGDFVTFGSSTGTITTGIQSGNSIRMIDDSPEADFADIVLSPSGTPSIGASVSGTITTTFSNGSINEGLARSSVWSLYWGRIASDPRGGTLQASATAIPEPSSALTLGIGALGFLAFRRCRK